MPAEGSILGHAVLRREDPSLLTGRDKYYDDMAIDGLTHAYFVRSSFAHGTLNSVDVSAAATMPGVIAAHSADTFELAPFTSFPLMPPATARPPLAKGKVRLVGDIVAVIVAETLAQAMDAGEAVHVDIDPLPAVIDPEAAAVDGAPLLFEEHGSNVVFETGIGLEDGDPLEGAAHVAECRTVSQRLAGVPMETNGCVAIPGADGQLTVWIPSQNPVAVRDALAAQLGMEASSLRVAAPMVGGGFGPKAGLYTEHVLISELARALGRPVKWTAAARTWCRWSTGGGW
jgi:carbon-monoxide dehydrogenase large subunit